MRAFIGSTTAALASLIVRRRIFFRKAVKDGCKSRRMFSRRSLSSSRYAQMDISCREQIRPNGTMRFTAGIQGGWRSGLKTEQRPVTNYDVTRDHDCSIWEQRSSRYVIFCGIATCKRLKCGMRTDFKTGSFRLLG